MSYLAFAKQIGLDKVVAFFVRVGGAVVQAVMKIRAERKRRREAAAIEKVDRADHDEAVRIDLTVVSISTETISLSRACEESPSREER